MTQLRDQLIENIEELPYMTVATYKDTDLLCVFCRDQEIAHFQNETEIDLRLTPKTIKQKDLKPPKNTESHPDRSKNSRWIVQSFETEEDIDRILELVSFAAEL